MPYGFQREPIREKRNYGRGGYGIGVVRWVRSFHETIHTSRPCWAAKCTAVVPNVCNITSFPMSAFLRNARRKWSQFPVDVHFVSRSAPTYRKVMARIYEYCEVRQVTLAQCTYECYPQFIGSTPKNVIFTEQKSVWLTRTSKETVCLFASDVIAANVTKAYNRLDSCGLLNDIMGKKSLRAGMHSQNTRPSWYQSWI